MDLTVKNLMINLLMINLMTNLMMNFFSISNELFPFRIDFSHFEWIEWTFSILNGLFPF